MQDKRSNFKARGLVDFINLKFEEATDEMVLKYDPRVHVDEIF